MSPEPSNEAPAAAYPIVAVGASAGGLAAVTQLLRRLGDRPGLAVVLVQHLDPTHASSLVPLLAKITPLPVSAAAEGMAVAVDHVYVIPPAVDLWIARGALHLGPRAESRAPHLSVDRFFDSLADDAGPRAMAVVLSGTGGDGARGVQAIKNAGGITFAQEGAEHAGMPESAIATGCVDFALPVSDIAAELVRIAAQAQAQAQAEDGAGEDDESFRRILAAIQRRTGVDFGHYKPTTLRRRMQRRAVLGRAPSLRAYADLVASDPAEADAISEEVLIHVTSFFRDPEVFAALKKDVFPRLLASRRGEGIRLWVAGCSSGEEVYSLAIGLAEFLAEAGAPQTPVKIFGTDVSRRAIDRARAGVYAENIAEDVEPARLARFFTKTARGFEILKELRDRCVFATHDLVRDPPFSKIDLISCRNLMIYLGPALQQRIIPMFHYALNDPGFVLLGTAETVGAFTGFTVADARNKIYARVPGAARSGFDFGEARAWGSARVLPRSPDRADPSAEVGKDADRAIIAAVIPAAVVVTDELAIVEFRGEMSPYLEPAPGAASLDLLRMAREDLRLALRRAVDQARTSGKPERSAGVAIKAGNESRAVDIEVIPFTIAPAGARFFAVLFREHAAPEGARSGGAPAADGVLAENAALRQELGSTRDYLQSVIEQLEAGNEEGRAANEEILSANEELQSTNEELQTAKEELQATNEELRTVNDEMVDRNAESTRLADDLANVLASVAIPIVLLGRDSRIRRFTPAATKIMNLIAADVGRPITDIRFNVPIPDLVESIAEVAGSLVPIERTLQAGDGRWVQLLIRPYRTLDNRIDGTVLSVYDIDTLKRGEIARAEDRVAESEASFRRMLMSAGDPILMSDAEGRIVFATGPADAAFGYGAGELVGLRLEDLLPPPAAEALPPRRGPFALPTPIPARARSLLARRKDGTTFPVDVSLSLLEGSEGRLTVTFLTDATARRDAELRIKEYQGKLQRMAFEAAKAQEGERRRIAQDLHDRVSQALALARIKLEEARAELPPGTRARIDTAVDLIAGALADSRTLTFELAPPILYDLGLKAALSWLGGEVERRFGVHIDVSGDDAAVLDEATAALVFRAVRELVMNVLKHAKTTRAAIALARVDGQLEIRVEDSGIGFDVEALARGPTAGFGLFAVREQVTRLGGVVDIDSTRDKGTRVILRVPITAEARAPAAAEGKNK